MYTETAPEVAARLKLNSASIDLKKTPKEKRTPQRVVPTIRRVAITTHP